MKLRETGTQLRAIVFAICCLSSLAVAQSSSVGTLNSHDLIYPGDLIEIDVLGGVEFDWRGRLNPEGFLEGYQVGGAAIQARCHSVSDLASAVAGALSRILKNPQVDVRILDRSGRANAVLLGAIRNPLRFAIRRDARLRELIVLGGGFTDQLSGTIRIFRPAFQSCGPGSEGNEARFIDIKLNDLLAGDVEADPLVYPGDVVTVGEAMPVYVVGGVNNPRAVLFREELTLSRAIASAGGLSKDAEQRDIVIYRRASGTSAVIKVNLENVAARREDDPPLQKGDIVDVGRSGRERRLVPNMGELNETMVADPSKMPLRVID